MISAILFSILNILRGGNYVGRILCTVLMGLVYAACLILGNHGWLDAGIAGLIGAVGFYLGLLFGWGKGLAAITGRYPRQEKDFWPADKVGDLVFDKTGNGYLAGIAFMTVRAVMFYPVYVASAAYLGNYWLLLTGLSVFAMGGVYWLAGKAVGEKHGVRVAEAAMGFIWGMALGVE